MEQQETLKAFIGRNKIRMGCEWAATNPNMDPTGDSSMNHYRCTLRMGRRSMVVPFSMGAALRGEPTAEDVLNCLASDSAGMENSPGFEEWAGEYGYDTDSRRAERLFHAIERQATRLKAFLGEEEYGRLLWHTERL